jgi:hypothetical protein
MLMIIIIIIIIIIILKSVIIHVLCYSNLLNKDYKIIKK